MTIERYNTSNHPMWHPGRTTRRPQPQCPGIGTDALPLTAPVNSADVVLAYDESTVTVIAPNENQ